MPYNPQAFAEFNMMRSVPTRFLTVLALKSQSEITRLQQFAGDVLHSHVTESRNKVLPQLRTYWRLC